MKKNFAKLAVLFALSSVSMFAEEMRVRVNVPFSFIVSGKTLPAGEYVVRPLDGFGTVLLVEGTSGEKALAMAQSLDSSSRNSALVFTKGESPALTMVRAFGRTFEINHTAPSAGGSLATIALPGVATIRK